MTADADVRQRISRDGLGETLFVEAGAGTGKTTELVSRIEHLVLHQGVALGNVAAITFTEAAAAELVDRIRVAFEKKQADTADEETREQCRRAIADADRAAISTLHGFARRILSEHPLAAGLPPRIGILDEVNSDLARETRWERFVDDLYEDPANAALLELAWLLGVDLEPRYHGHATLKDVAAELGQNWDLLDTVADRPLHPLPSVDFGPFDRAAGAVEALPDRCPEDSGDLFRLHLVDTVLPSLRRITGITDPDRKLQALAKAADWTRSGGGKPGNWGCEVKTLKDLVTALNTARDEVKGTVSDAILARLLTLLAREVRAAAEIRRSEGNLEFHDLLVLARRLLRTSPQARQALHDRYTHLLLDEFQDTDPIQVELAVLIAGAVHDGAGDVPDWADVTVDPGRLFFVGDPKQSIYRFRRADIGLFLRARDTFGAGGKSLRLTTNFRTVPAILDWVNVLFERLMPDEVPECQPKYERLQAHRQPAPGADHRPVLLGQPHAKALAGELRDLEAGAVAEAINRIQAAPEEWPVLDDDTRQWRPARLTDVTILVPTRTSLPHLRAALEAAAIPYRLNTGTLVYGTQEVRDALAALRAVDDATDQLSLVAALRSPLYACSDRDLFAWRHAGGAWDLRAKDVPQALDEAHPVAAALSHLRSLWLDRWWVGPSTLLCRLLEERQAFLLAFGEGRAPEVWGRLRFLVDQARAFEEAGGGDLRAFIGWAELQSSESARLHEPLLPETDDDAVRIMTIHGAKGLEFPITILSGLTTKPSSRRTGVSVLWHDGMPEAKLRKGIATANYDPRADIEAEMDVHEKRRLLYVAATRARDHLIVAAHHKAGDGSYACMVWDEMQSLPDAWRTLPDGDPGAGPASPSPMAPAAAPAAPADDRDAWLVAREALLAPQRRSRVTSATTIARESLTSAVADEDFDPADPADQDGGPVPPRRRGRAGTAIGRAVHATLQFTDFAYPEGIDEQAARQADLEAIPELAEQVAAMARSALDSEAVSLAGQHPHHKELYVAAPVGDRIVEGYVDLLIETPAGLVIVDYKTDTVGSEGEIDAKLAVYELQGGAYAVALETSTGLPVVACRFVFCRSTGAVERAVADLPAAKARVLQVLERPAG